LKLGNWIEEFAFTKTNTSKTKEIPTDDQLTQFYIHLSEQVQLVFLVLLSTGFRIGEVLSLRLGDIDYDTGLVDASQIHSGNTKHSWKSFVTYQTKSFIEEYMYSDGANHDDDESNIFSVSSRSVQKEFSNVSKQTGIIINPHLLRTVFSEKCREAEIEKEYINAFCGRTSKGILEKHYTVYSPQSLRKQYDKVEQLLTLKLS